METTRSLLENVIPEILVRLPVKSLLRFKCVRRSWCDLINRPSFIEKHLICCPLEPQLLTQRGFVEDPIATLKYIDDSVRNRTWDMLTPPLETITLISIHPNDKSLNLLSPELPIPHFNYSPIFLRGPCNGVFCVGNTLFVMLCNPATREFRLLPPSRILWRYRHLLSNAESLGFGSDSSNVHDLKVIRLQRQSTTDDSYYALKAELYTQSSNIWRQIDWVSERFVFGDHPRGEIFFNNHYHWYGGPEGGTGDIILTFDMKTERFGELVFPYGGAQVLGVLNDCLAFVAYTETGCTSEVPDDHYVHIWVMNEYGVSESVTKLFTIGPLFLNMQPISIWTDVVFFESNIGQLISLDLNDHSIHSYDFYGMIYSMHAVMYRESLISINPQVGDTQEPHQIARQIRLLKEMKRRSFNIYPNQYFEPDEDYGIHELLFDHNEL